MSSHATNTTKDASGASTGGASKHDPKSFDWPLAYDAEKFLSQRITAFLELNSFARQLAQRVRDETGTDFFEWVDHLVLSSDDEKTLRAAGFVPDLDADAPKGCTVLHHPRAT